ncbi:MAG: hypothetical protein JZU47_10145 [Prolixibacteraceae bacterium]|nr:hypothetical protein [Prolixibacteraceae bacterium]
MTIFLFKRGLSFNSILNLFFGLTFILLLIGCSVFYTKNNYIHDFNSFIKDVKENYANYSESDWIRVDKQYTKYTGELYEKFKPELTTEEMLTIGKLKGTYTALKVKKGANELFDQAKEMINQAKEVLDSTVETINK